MDDLTSDRGMAEISLVVRFNLSFRECPSDEDSWLVSEEGLQIVAYPWGKKAWMKFALGWK